MPIDPEGARFRLGDAGGHYESWFLRANHPTRPLAFWIRYTVTSPKARPHEAVAELFAIVFDGESGRHAVARQAYSLLDADFPTSGLGVRIGSSHLEREGARGSAQGPPGAPGADAPRIAWDLTFAGGGGPMLLLPARFYSGGFPRAKSLVMRPGVTFGGHVAVGDAQLNVDGWAGSLNHNWGERHTDRYAWGQVIGFVEHPETALEVATARIRLGPVLSPPMTPIVLRHRGREHRLNALHKVFGRATLQGLDWSFKAKGEGIALHGTMRCEPRDVVTLYYTNPPGGRKICVNSKIARCELILETEAGTERLSSPHGAAFELLVDALGDVGLVQLPEPI